MFSPSKSFRGWELGKYLKGRKKLLVTGVGYVAGYFATRNPVLAGVIAATAELVYAIIDYYYKEMKAE